MGPGLPPILCDSSQAVMSGSVRRSSPPGGRGAVNSRILRLDELNGGLRWCAPRVAQLSEGGREVPAENDHRPPNIHGSEISAPAHWSPTRAAEWSGLRLVPGHENPGGSSVLPESNGRITCRSPAHH